MLRIGLVSLFPEIFDALHYGIIGRAIKTGLVSLNFWNPRAFANNKHGRVDDRPYGGGPGMVMMYEPLHKAIRAAKEVMPAARVVYLTPQGRRLEQEHFVEKMSADPPELIFVSGRYEGIDERVILQDIDEEWSVGDYVLSGGEFAAMVCIDALVRLIPGALGDENSLQVESFAERMLDYPQYTRPAEIDGLSVPEVLLRGNHNEIEAWRKTQALEATLKKRPDLCKNK